MNIAIITQALLDNYGGLLQNYALQQTLKNMGHDPCTVDICQMTNTYKNFFRVLGSWVKTIFLYVFKDVKRKFAKFYQPKKRKMFSESFVRKYINVTKPMKSYSASFFNENKFDVIIVGSDQVWRPKFNMKIEDMYLKFAKDLHVKKISYASSFGVDKWEYTRKQTNECSMLAKKFRAISVREYSGVELCKKYLSVDASFVLDPTLLLSKNDYLKLCEQIPVSQKKIIAAYILNLDENICKMCNSFAKEKGLELRFFTADSNATLSVAEWLAMFRDASYVITDSFHGTVFSIIFEKEFKCVYNNARGAARFESLLNLYNSGKLEEMRQFSLNWLKHALES